MSASYMVLYCSEDGGCSLNTYSREDLEQKLTDREWGDATIMQAWSGSLGDAPGPCLFIFDGRLVEPRAVKTVVRMRLP